MASKESVSEELSTIVSEIREKLAYARELAKDHGIPFTVAFDTSYNDPDDAWESSNEDEEWEVSDY